jgi:hypothetical protein
MAADGEQVASYEIEPRLPGRPSRYSESLAVEFCSRLRTGLSVIEVCAADDMPSQSTIYDWLKKFPDFSEKYVRACEEREDYFTEEEIPLERMVLKGRIKPDNFSAVMKNRWRRREQLARKKYGKQLQVDANVTFSPADMFSASKESVRHDGDA